MVQVFSYVRETSAVYRVEFVSHKLYIILSGGWCVFVLNVHDPTEDKIDVRRTASKKVYSINSLTTIKIIPRFQCLIW
jgi:hypothetical protein